MLEWQGPLIEASPSLNDIEVNKPQGFKNMSSTTLDNQLTNMLDKGPSFVNANLKDLPKHSLLAKASLQRVTDRLKGKWQQKFLFSNLKETLK